VVPGELPGRGGPAFRSWLSERIRATYRRICRRLTRPNVRATAGEALAARRELKAAPRLLALVKKSDPGAAGPLALLATPDLVPHIAELAGSVDDGVLATTLGEYVKRSDVPDKLRVDVLRTVSNLPGAAATTALIEYIAAVPAKDDRPSKKEAQKLLDERGTKE
jgi:hypothetical protein